ncbi:hypothetical protein RRG08_025974 [Elysia crispata]|uniref:Uncharacterized protein n=1 Tax=Elysia crispata TaxID=231223 RepID=A0AAE0ZH92_9GAST|nr:hypothetical protein RRG08_025974 [Elysia crispata]
MLLFEHRCGGSGLVKAGGEVTWRNMGEVERCIRQISCTSTRRYSTLIGQSIRTARQIAGRAGRDGDFVSSSEGRGRASRGLKEARQEADIFTAPLSFRSRSNPRASHTESPRGKGKPGDATMAWKLSFSPKN